MNKKEIMWAVMLDIEDAMGLGRGGLMMRTRDRLHVWGRNVYIVIGRRLGCTYEEIGRGLGMSASNVQHLLKTLHDDLYRQDAEYTSFFDELCAKIDDSKYDLMLYGEAGLRGVPTVEELLNIAVYLRKVGEFARMCGVSSTAVYKWRDSGEITMVDMAGMCFVVMDKKADKKVTDMKWSKHKIRNKN